MDLNNLIINVNKLSIQEKKHVYDILKDNNCVFSHNKSGYFFDLNKIEQKTIDKISKCIELIHRHRELIAQLDKRRDEEILYYKNLISQKNEVKNTNLKNFLIESLSLKNIDSCIEWTIEKKTHVLDKNNKKDDVELIKFKFKFKPKHQWYRIYEVCKKLRKQSHTIHKTIHHEANDIIIESIILEYDDLIQDEQDEQGDVKDIDHDIEDKEDIEEDLEEDLEQDIEDLEEDVEEDLEEDLEDPGFQEFQSILKKEILNKNDIMLINNFDLKSFISNSEKYNKFKLMISDCTENYIFNVIKDKIKKYKITLTTNGFIFDITLNLESYI